MFSGQYRGIIRQNVVRKASTYLLAGAQRAHLETAALGLSPLPASGAGRGPGREFPERDISRFDPPDAATQAQAAAGTMPQASTGMSSQPLTFWLTRTNTLVPTAGLP